MKKRPIHITHKKKQQHSCQIKIIKKQTLSETKASH